MNIVSSLIFDAFLAREVAGSSSLFYRLWPPMTTFYIVVYLAHWVFYLHVVKFYCRENETYSNPGLDDHNLLNKLGTKQLYGYFQWQCDRRS